MAHFTQDSRAEGWLKQRGVRFDYVEQIRFSELESGWFGVNQGRPDSVPKDEALIEKYASAMDQGAVFPSPILAKNKGGYEVLDGCQRLCAAELCGQTLFNAYVIKSDNPAVRAPIRICANSVLNGTAPSQDWTISKIVDVLYEQHNFSAVDCSQWSGQPVKKIEIEIDSRDAKHWLKGWGVDTSVKPANQKGFLAAFARCFPLLDRQHLTKELPDLVKQLQSVKANNDEAVHLMEECANIDINKRNKCDYKLMVKSRIAEVMGRPEIQARMTSPRTLHPIDNVMRALTSALTSMRSAARGEHHADPDQSEQILVLLAEARKLAKRIVPRELWTTLAEQHELPQEVVA